MTVYFSEETSSVQSVRIRGRALGGGGGGEGDSGGTFVCGLGGRRARRDGGNQPRTSASNNKPRSLNHN